MELPVILILITVLPAHPGIWPCYCGGNAPLHSYSSAMPWELTPNVLQDIVYLCAD